MIIKMIVKVYGRNQSRDFVSVIQASCWLLTFTTSKKVWMIWFSVVKFSKFFHTQSSHVEAFLNSNVESHLFSGFLKVVWKRSIKFLMLCFSQRPIKQVQRPLSALPVLLPFLI